MRGQLGRRLGDVLEENAHRRLGLERQPAGEALKRDHPEAVEIAARLGRQPARLLG